jgi:hypothetical protein
MTNQNNYKFSVVTIVGGLFLAIVACQLTIYMQKANDEMDYREICARHASQPITSSSDEAALKKLGLGKGHSVSKFCQHYK